MKNFISELYLGNISPRPGHFQRGKEFQEAMSIMTDSENQLDKRLDSESKALFLAYVSASDELISTTSAETFADGFRLGAAFAFDAFCGADSLYYT